MFNSLQLEEAEFRRIGRVSLRRRINIGLALSFLGP